MFKAIALTLVAAIVPVRSEPVPQQPVTLQDLTVPADLLTAGCGLAPAASVRLDNQQVQAGFWDGFPSNPWTGTDRHVIASIYERMYRMPPMPDGPPLDRSGQARFRLRLADGVDEGYAAFYQESDPPRPVGRVYALRFADTERIADLNRGARPPDDDRLITWIRFGRIVALMIGHRDECSQAVDRHLKSLAAQR